MIKTSSTSTQPIIENNSIQNIDQLDQIPIIDASKFINKDKYPEIEWVDECKKVAKSLH